MEVYSTLQAKQTLERILSNQKEDEDPREAGDWRYTGYVRKRIARSQQENWRTARVGKWDTRSEDNSNTHTRACVGRPKTDIWKISATTIL